MNKELLITEISNWSSDNSLFVTLNTMTKDNIKFDVQLRKIAHKLNDYCYGRSYKRKEKQLKIIAATETGKLNGLLHAHLIVSFPDENRRSIQEINAYIRRHWYALIGLGNPFGTMVDVRRIGDLNERVKYLVKDTDYWLRNDLLNIAAL
jgi:hypothetical protein